MTEANMKKTVCITLLVYMLFQLIGLGMYIKTKAIIKNENKQKMEIPNTDLSYLKIGGYSLGDTIDSLLMYPTSNIGFEDKNGDKLGGSQHIYGEIARIHASKREVDIAGILSEYSNTDYSNIILGIPIKHTNYDTKTYIDREHNIMMTIYGYKSSKIEETCEYIDIRRIDDAESRESGYSIIEESSLNPLAVIFSIKNTMNKIPNELPNSKDYCQIPLYMTIVIVPILLLPILKWQRGIVGLNIAMILYYVIDTIVHAVTHFQ